MKTLMQAGLNGRVTAAPAKRFLIHSLCVSLAVAGWAGGAFAAAFSNPGFEADVFNVPPGSVASNRAITGWTASHAEAVGLNPAGGLRPYADNGAVPEGANVAYVVSRNPGEAGLSTLLTGLTPGETYKVGFRVNAKGGQTPDLAVGVDAMRLVRLSVSPVAATGTLTTAYRYAAVDFVAAGETAMFSVTNTTATGVHAALLDAFTIDVSARAWSVARWNDDASSGVASGGVYTHAYNLGSSAPAVINGVTFTGVAGINPAVAGRFATTGLGSTAGDGGNALITAGGGSAVLAANFVYNGYPATLTLHGLAPGATYETTIFSVAWEPAIRSATFSLGTDRFSVDQDAYGDNAGIRVMCRFKATAASMTLAAAPLKGASYHVYGFCNRLLDDGAPIIMLPPRSQVGAVGATNAFRVLAVGATPLAYEWRQDGETVAGATQAVLTVAVGGPEQAGGYAVVVANGAGSVTSAVAQLTLGPIANPGFEADDFLADPGYVGRGGANPANFPITGWLASDTNRVGLNPIVGGQSPFADNGTIPEGRQVAFLQSNVTGSQLSTALRGLVPGRTYTVGFRFNKRVSTGNPLLQVLIDGVVQVDASVGAVAAAGAPNPYRYGAVDFTATAETHILGFGNLTAADSTLLIDDVRIAPSSSNWSFAAWDGDATSGIEAGGRYSHAYKFGDGQNAEVNGLQFRGLIGPAPAVVGQFGTTGFPNFYLNDVTNALTAAGGGSARLGRSFAYGAMEETLSIYNLVPGAEYRATLWLVGFEVRTTSRTATFSVGEDRLTINEDHFGLGKGLRVAYRYVADATGSVTLRVSATSVSTIHVYGFANQELASPSAPVIYRQPQDEQWVGAGDAVTLAPLVGGQAPLLFQWRKGAADVVGATNLTLHIPAAQAADAGTYALTVSNAMGTVVSSNAVVEVGAPVVNPSFEANAFVVAPGYVAANGAIAGWTLAAGAAGINPLAYSANNPTAAAYTPFCNSGVIPDGRQAAFIQGVGRLTQVVGGLRAGATYYVKYFENARTGQAAPTASVTAGGVVVVPPRVVTAGAYRVQLSAPFLATGDSIELAFVNAGGDSVLLDRVAVLELGPTAPTVSQDPAPASQMVAEGSQLVLTARVFGTLPMAYQWQRNGIDVVGQNAAVLTIDGVEGGAAGEYRLSASNLYGRATSAVATVVIGRRIPVFSTGLNDDGSPAPGGQPDPHYRLVASADPVNAGPDAFVLAPAHVAYLPNSTNSQWISTQGTIVNLPVGGYNYRTDFSMAGLNLATARLDGRFAIDNAVNAILLNGVNTGIPTQAGFAAFWPFSITNGFVAGVNTLEFVTENQSPPGPHAFRVEIGGLAVPAVGGTVLLVR